MLYFLLLGWLLALNSIFFYRLRKENSPYGFLTGEKLFQVGIYLLGNALVLMLVAGFNLFIDYYWMEGFDDGFMLMFIMMMAIYLLGLKRPTVYCFQVGIIAIIFIFVEKQMDMVAWAMLSISMLVLLLQYSFRYSALWTFKKRRPNEV